MIEDNYEQPVRVVVRGRWHTGRIVRHAGLWHGEPVVVVRTAEGEVRRFEKEIQILD